MKLTIRDVTKTYRNGVQALKNVSLTIPLGMYGLLGPNGAGKSTLMRTIATLQEPNQGSMMLDDMDVLREKDAMRRVLGYLPQEFGVYPNVSAEEMLNHFAVLKGISNSSERKEIIKALLQQTNLYEVRKKNLGSYSGGMKQRFGIAQALLGSPQIIIVDEPTAGLDPAERNRFHNLLSEIGENVIVILSTHIVEDVTDLCRNFAIINKGEVLLEGDPLQVIDSIRGCIWRKFILKSQLEAHQLEYDVISSRLYAGKTIIHVLSDVQPGAEFEAVAPDLEDVYFSKIHEAGKREKRLKKN
ncbi:ABC transporter ATP-binding protein [Pontibacter toksunensis]|uniref:ABC transporter ATP-binding protein n=1 Tax=Pontibacter toksunensis TaxID=1332631 RepID=A0ABW6BZK8_9BACT